MTYPKVLLTSGIEIDSHNYALTFTEAKENFFQPKEYYILPYIPKHKNIAGKTIFLPYISDEIDRTSEIEISKVFKFPKIHLVKRELYINTIFKSFWNDLVNILGEKELKNIKIVEFQITNVGSGGRTFITDNDTKIIVRNRKDILPELMFSTLVMGVLKLVGYKEDYAWEERMAIKSWIENSTVLKKYFNHNFIPMLSNLRLKQQQGKYQLESQEYLKKLGIYKEVSIDKEGDLIINGNHIGLSKNENSFLKVLNEYKGKIVDYDTIFEGVWGGDSEKFSLYAITKLVERVRNKMQKLGISKDFITSVKGKGYCMK
jgi:hypothetical protein